MRSIIVKHEYSGKKIDRVVKEIFKNMPIGAIYKALRKKDIKINNKRAKEGDIVKEGDKIEIFLPDDIIDGVINKVSFEQVFSVVYEDDNILIVNKKQGVPVHPDRNQNENTLIDILKIYLKGKSNIYLCHRLDRNTGGLLITAKNDKALKILLDKIKANKIKKYYQCLVFGRFVDKNKTLKAYLTKDERKNRVFISDNKVKGSVEIITKYKVLEEYKTEYEFTKLEVELITGKTHQIRAHLSHIGHQILGDGKYGLNNINKGFKYKYQCLWATKIVFDFKDNSLLGYLSGRSFQIEPEF